MRRGLRLGLITGLALFATAPSALADHHEIKISEVFPGSSEFPDAEFVEIQMYTSGQNLLASADMQFYNAGGTPLVPPLELANVANGQSQRTLLVGTPAFESLFTIQADVELGTALLSPAGGGVCVVSEVGFGTLDCVAWGTATVAGAGTSEPAIPDGSSINRDVSPNCNTLLEAADDSGSSATDFNPAFPTPQPNSQVGPNSTCPNTQITKKPKAKTTDRTPKFEFSGGDEYECRLDGGIYEDCGSPYEPGRLSRGKHKLEVRATEPDGSIDGTPAKYSWKIVRKR
jgi:hypothetical protein